MTDHGADHRHSDRLAGEPGELVGLGALVDDLPLAVFEARPDGRVLRTSAGWPLVTATAGGAEIDLVALAHPTDRARLADALDAARTGTQTVVELRVLTVDGSTRAVTGVVGPSRAGPDRVVGFLEDATPRRAREHELAQRAAHDALTGLANRTALVEHLDGALARAARSGRPMGALFLDLDRLKAVNDRFGHAAGDAALRQVAERVRSAVRPGDLAARFGGDELAVVCEDAPAGALVAVGRRILGAIASPPVTVDGVQLTVTASVGVAAVTTGRAGRVSPERLLQEADTAMYQAKQRGRARVEVFRDALGGRARGRTEMAHDLAAAVSQGAIRVLYQPLVELDRDVALGFEALPEWEHPERGVVPRGELLALARDTGLAGALGIQVLRRACAQARAWAEPEDSPPPRLHVDLPTPWLHDTRLVEHVGAVLDETGLEAVRLCVEIPEDVFCGTGDEREARATLTGLRGLGVRLAVDGFGVGPASLGALRDAELDLLKIAPPVVERVHAPRSIAYAAVQVAHALGVSAAADGVETGAQAEALRDLGCDAAQGGWFGPPVHAPGAGALPASRFAS